MNDIEWRKHLIGLILDSTNSVFLDTPRHVLYYKLIDALQKLKTDELETFELFVSMKRKEINNASNS